MAEGDSADSLAKHLADISVRPNGEEVMKFLMILHDTPEWPPVAGPSVQNLIFKRDFDPSAYAVQVTPGLVEQRYSTLMEVGETLYWKNFSAGELWQDGYLSIDPCYWLTQDTRQGFCRIQQAAAELAAHSAVLSQLKMKPTTARGTYACDDVAIFLRCLIVLCTIRVSVGKLCAALPDGSRVDEADALHAIYAAIVVLRDHKQTAQYWENFTSVRGFP